MDRNGWALAFVFTLLAETPVYFLGLRRVFGARGALAASLLLNVATHPLAWSAIMAAPRPFPYVFLGVEGAVTLIEALLLFGAGRSRLARRPLGAGEALAISLAANGFSAGLGLLL
jgi:hypothetical protein